MRRFALLAVLVLMSPAAGKAQGGFSCQSRISDGPTANTALLSIRCERQVNKIELIFVQLSEFEPTASVAITSRNERIASLSGQRSGNTLTFALEPPLSGGQALWQVVDRQAATSFQIRATTPDGSTGTGSSVGGTGGPATGNCSQTSVGYPPLTDLGARTYQGQKGGLYAGGKNVPSAAYLKKGLAAAAQVRPRGSDGVPAPDGRIVLLSIGHSTASQLFTSFKRLADADARKSPAVTIVDGAQSGADAKIVAAPSAPFWTEVERILTSAGVTPAQVQAAWLHESFANPAGSFAADAQELRTALRAIIANMTNRYPNLRLVYLSSRTYAGYATTTLNPEPYAYQGGFAVKWVIGDRIDGKLDGPWLGWGPYLWADGTKGRKDGLSWTCQDFGPDGAHPSASGSKKVADLLLRHFTSDPTARSWFKRR